MELFGALVFFAFATSITPGPNNIMIMSSGVNYGVQKSLAHLAGIQTGFLLMLLAVGLGAGLVLQQQPLLQLTAPQQRRRFNYAMGTLLALTLSKAAADPRYMALGAAVPALAFLPQHALQKALQQVMKADPTRLMRYETSRGAPELRLQIARRMALRGRSNARHRVI